MSRACISVTAEHYKRLVDLHKERGVTYDAMIEEALAREEKRQARDVLVPPRKVWRL